MLSNERKLWLPQGKNQVLGLGVQNSIKDGHPTADREAELKAMIEQFSTRPTRKTLWTLCCNSLVVGQQFAIACFLLAANRVGTKEKEQEKQQLLWEHLASLLPVSIILFSILRCSETISLSPDMMKIWAEDAILLPAMLSLLAAGLSTLTDSYSADTVLALALGGLLVHLLCCDYSYANGRIVSAHSTPRNGHGRRPFLGGTFSLNAALFSTTLLASRLSSNSAVYVFTSTSVIVFVFFPAARHSLSKQPHAPYGTFFWGMVML